jgi:hypothetical protein
MRHVIKKKKKRGLWPKLAIRHRAVDLAPDTSRVSVPERLSAVDLTAGAGPGFWSFPEFSATVWRPLTNSTGDKKR